MAGVLPTPRVTGTHPRDQHPFPGVEREAKREARPSERDDLVGPREIHLAPSAPRRFHCSFNLICFTQPLMGFSMVFYWA